MTATRPVLTGFAGVVLDRPETALRHRGDLDMSVDVLTGVGPKVAERLRKLGLETVRDLAEHLPRGFLSWSEAGGFDQLLAGDEATVRCAVERISLRPTRRRNLKIVQATVRDDAGSRVTAVWFNQAYLVDQLPPGTRLLLHGRLEGGGYGPPTFRVDRHERDDEAAGLHTLGLVPLYPASETVSTAKLRELAEQALARSRWARDPLPARVRAAEGEPLRADALALAHRPARPEDAEVARRRLAFEELVLLMTGLARAGRAVEHGPPAPSLGAPGPLLDRYRAALPFALTPEQEAAIRAIDQDLVRETPMGRLLQGDVGSGKTVVALYALLRAVERGHQGALMAPTETLAEQHFLTVERLVSDLGARVLLLTSSLGPRALGAARDAVAAGEADVVVGTHALIQEHVRFASLAVAVVDEQHRFGVEQRRALSRPWPTDAPAGQSPAPRPPDAAGRHDGPRGRASRTVPSAAAPPAAPHDPERTFVPHVLHMTATPIPRTLAMTVYGDLDVTEIARPPRDRKPVVTSWVTHERSGEAYTRLRKHLEAGRQAYVVCPLVSESETVEARAAEEEAERLRHAELRGFGVGCLHGKLGAAERRDVMERFKRRELDVLVATTVIEVGVDVPNATIMIVQEADRFGLAQLHQLRGRVGRGAEQSYCLLVSRPREALTEAAQARLRALTETTDGFRLAEVDLELRGEGELLGTRQSGLPDLRFASLTRDRELIARAKRWAAELVDEEGPFAAEVERFFAGADHRGIA
jgi:ATP-dependent DNA helicase RecG